MVNCGNGAKKYDYLIISAAGPTLLPLEGIKGTLGEGTVQEIAVRYASLCFQPRCFRSFAKRPFAKRPFGPLRYLRQGRTVAFLVTVFAHCVIICFN